MQFAYGETLAGYMDDADDLGRPDELLAEGTVRYNHQEQCWAAEIDWSALRHASDEVSRRSP